MNEGEEAKASEKRTTRRNANDKARGRRCSANVRVRPPRPALAQHPGCPQIDRGRSRTVRDHLSGEPPGVSARSAVTAAVRSWTATTPCGCLAALPQEWCFSYGGVVSVPA